VREEVEYLSLHRYVGNEDDDTPNYLAVTASIDRQIEATDAICRSVYHTRKTKRRVYLSCDEWNVWYRARHGEHVDGKGKFAPPLLEEIYNLEDALVAAGFLNSFIRHADSVKIANLAQIVNVIAPIFTRGDEMVLQTIFYAIELYANRRTGTSLQTVVDGPSYETRRYGRAHYLDTSAILNGDELHVFLVNRSLDEPMDVQIKLADASVVSLVNADFLSGKDPKAVNSFEHPHRVQSCSHEDVSFKDGVATVSLPPLCVYGGTFKLER
jgi:alpha-N-arabinofuranosidase